MSNPPVILTRPLAQALAQASFFAGQLSTAGREVVIFPCMEIHALDDYSILDQALRSLDCYAMIAFVSPNAIGVTLQRLAQLGLSLPRGLTIAVMGAGSTSALQQYGIDNSTHRIIRPQNPERTDSETLLQALDLATLSGQQVLIIRGQNGRELLAEALRQNAVLVTQVAAYSRAAPKFDAEKQAQFLQLLNQGGDWVVSSSEILATLLSWAQSLDHLGNFSSIAGIDACVVKMQQQHLVVPHRRIAENGQILGFQSITLTGSGDERLLVALQSRL
jgi:uroporphyrinogen-III synthase